MLFKRLLNVFIVCLFSFTASFCAERVVHNPLCKSDSTVAAEAADSEEEICGICFTEFHNGESITKIPFY